MNFGIRIDAFIDRNGSVEPFFLEISEPVPSIDDDFYCVVHMPGILKRDGKIFGIDAVQARQLAVDFVNSMLDGAKIVDRDGGVVALGEGDSGAQ
ncbi:hypothetical protein [Xanthomonas medicagonis]|uniref:hypothetical protein n=1 Tax=Xanthomonas medicagonis TaxID=3160841 RepID=UPI003513C010